MDRISSGNKSDSDTNSVKDNSGKRKKELKKEYATESKNINVWTNGSSRTAEAVL